MKIYKENELINFSDNKIKVLKFDDEQYINFEINSEKYNKNIISNESSQTKNIDGEYLLYEEGEIIDYSPIFYMEGIRVSLKFKNNLDLLISSSRKDLIPIKLTSGLRTWDEQIELRKSNLKNKSKVDDLKVIIEYPSFEFSPETARPGYNCFQSGRVFCFNTSNQLVYKWLNINAIKFGFIRLFKDYRWIWGYLPNLDKYTYVPNEDTTWEN